MAGVDDADLEISQPRGLPPGNFTVVRMSIISLLWTSSKKSWQNKFQLPQLSTALHHACLTYTS